MFKGKSDHIVLACSNLAATRSFYEGVIGIVPDTVLDDYITYNLGGFFLCFKASLGGPEFGIAVKHVGIEFPLRTDVDLFFEKLRESDYPPVSESIVGGSGKGPYRFYVKDPSGYTLEFESWEGCSN